MQSKSSTGSLVSVLINTILPAMDMTTIIANEKDDPPSEGK